MKSTHISIPNHPLVRQIIITQQVGDHYEGWLNDTTEARNYFTLKLHPQIGWLANLGTGWAKAITAEQLANLIRCDLTPSHPPNAP